MTFMKSRCILFGVMTILSRFADSSYVPSRYELNQERPIELIVDLVNSYGIRVLNEHNFLNENNIAFSPYGLGGILIALYEGVSGDSSYEIRRSMSLPWDRRLIRAGFRDVHRSMKTYFIPEEGFLAGLSFNKQGIKLNTDYKDILNFYGFDFEMFEMEQGTTRTTTQMPTSAVALASPSPSSSVTSPPPPSTTDKVETTQTAQTNAPMTTQAATVTTTQIKTTADVENKESLNEVTTRAPSTTQAEKSTDIVATSSNSSNDDSNKDKPSSPIPETDVITTTNDLLTTTNRAETTFQPNTDFPTETTVVFSSNTPNATEREETDTNFKPTKEITVESSTNEVTTFVTSTKTIESPATSNSTLISSPSFEISTTVAATVSQSSIVPLNSSSSAESETMDPLQVVIESMRSATDNINTEPTVTDMLITTGFDSSPDTVGSDLTENTISSPKDEFEILKNLKLTTERLPQVTVMKRGLRSVPEIRPPPPRRDQFHFHNTYHFNNPNFASEGLHRQSMFLCPGNRKSKVEYMTYNSYLDFVYLPYLRCLVLKLPLDNDKYYMLIFLPETEYGLSRLIKEMAEDRTNLKTVHESLQNVYVNAWVPSFMVKGIISLTSDLQRLGIRTVFESRQHDFGPMTNSKDIYVRNVEQSITITIKKYKEMQDIQRRYGESDPWTVQFAATHPFLYFIMDSEIQVALMAGKIVDPLNSRIL